MLLSTENIFSLSYKLSGDERFSNYLMELSINDVISVFENQHEPTA